MKTEELLDWIVRLDFAHYETTKTPEYDPKCNSHFYLKGSQERFSSSEIIKIFTNKMSNNLYKRWQEALAENINFIKKH